MMTHSSLNTRSGAAKLITQKARVVKNIMRQKVYRTCSQSELTWRYLANLGPWLAYQRQSCSLDQKQISLLTTLKRDGIAITSVSEFFGMTSLFDELATAVKKREESLTHELDKARAEIDSPGQVKSYLIKLLGDRPILDPNDIFSRVALHPHVLTLVNSYFGMFARLRHFNVWHNLPTQAAPRESQLWHRDPEDRYVLKMFIYLTDVGDGSGPLSYAPGTHALGNVSIDPQARLMSEGSEGRETARSDDQQMREVVKEDQWITATGPKGTVAFVDTRGYHKGGLVRQHDRIVYMCTFTSKASILLEDLFERKMPLPQGADAATTFACAG